MCSQIRLLLLYSLKVDYLKYLPANIVASHTHYDKEGNSYSMGTCIAEKGKTKYVLFKVPGGSKYAVIISVSWCNLLLLIVRNLFKSITSSITFSSACIIHKDLRVAYFDLDEIFWLERFWSIHTIYKSVAYIILFSVYIYIYTHTHWTKL